MSKKLICYVFIGILSYANPIHTYKLYLTIIKNNKEIYNKCISFIKTNDKLFENFPIYFYKNKGFLYMKCKKSNNTISQEIGGIILHNNNSFDAKCHLDKNSLLKCDFNFYKVFPINKNLIQKAIETHKCVNLFPKEVKKSFIVRMNITNKPKKVSLGKNIYLIYKIIEDK